MPAMSSIGNSVHTGCLCKFLHSNYSRIRISLIFRLMSPTSCFQAKFGMSECSFRPVRQRTIILNADGGRAWTEETTEIRTVH